MNDNLDAKLRKIVRGDFGQLQVIPSWEMQAFMAEVENYRLKAIHHQMKLSAKPEKVKKFRSLKDAAAYLRAKAGEDVDPETGEIMAIDRLMNVA